jgi:hypothetical protein
MKMENTVFNMNTIDLQTYCPVPKPKPQFNSAEEWYTKEMTCVSCGHKSTSREETKDGVAPFNNWIGGQGYVWREECANKHNCNRRLGWTKEVFK